MSIERVEVGDPLTFCSKCGMVFAVRRRAYDHEKGCVKPEWWSKPQGDKGVGQ